MYVCVCVARVLHTLWRCWLLKIIKNQYLSDAYTQRQQTFKMASLRATNMIWKTNLSSECAQLSLLNAEFNIIVALACCRATGFCIIRCEAI